MSDNNKGQSLSEFLTKQQFQIRVQSVEARTDGLMSDTPMNHWLVTLSRVGFGPWPRMTFFYSKGIGHKGQAPKLDEVVDSLASDATSIVNARSFEEWCSDYGYDDDSRTAYKVWQQCVEQTKQLRDFLKEHFDAVLFECERL